MQSALTQPRSIAAVDAPSAEPARVDGISVVICTYNRRELMGKLLDSLLDQLPAPVPVEIVVVDNACTDDTAAHVSAVAERHPEVRYVLEPEQGLSRARNAGAAAAKFDYLIYLDDDATTPPHFLESLANVLHEHQPDLFGGPIYPSYVDPRPPEFPDDMEIRKKADRSGFHNEITLSGGNLGIRKSTLARIGGFDVRYGMSGKKLNLLEDRLLVEAYRRTTPASKQKLYYSLETFIYHHTPAKRMQVGFQTQRAYVGKAQLVEHALELGIRRPGLLFKSTIRALPSAAYRSFRARSRRAQSEKDGIEYVRSRVAFAFRRGEFVGALRFMLSPRRFRVRRDRRVAPPSGRPLLALYLTVEDPSLPFDKLSTTLRELRIVEHRRPELLKVKAVQVQPVSRYIRETLSESNLRSADALFFSDYKYMRTLHSSRTAHPHLQFLMRLQVPKTCSYPSYARRTGGFSMKRMLAIIVREFLAVRRVDEVIVRGNEKMPLWYGRLLAPWRRRRFVNIMKMAEPGTELTYDEQKKEDRLVALWKPVIEEARRWAPVRWAIEPEPPQAIAETNASARSLEAVGRR